VEAGSVRWRWGVSSKYMESQAEAGSDRWRQGMSLKAGDFKAVAGDAWWRQRVTGGGKECHGRQDILR
jgi:hypothetical protein